MEKTSTYINLIKEEWRVEKSKNSINVEGGFLLCGGWNFSKSVSVSSTAHQKDISKLTDI